MQYRIDKKALLETLSIWDSHLGRKARLIACGGTAMTLLNIKESTKDVDFIVPDNGEYKYLIRVLEDLGYEKRAGSGWTIGEGFIFELYSGKSVFTTELLDSPLKKGNNISLKEFEHIYLGVLNYYDLIITKIFRASSVDIDDCSRLFKAKQAEIDIEKLKEKFYKTSSYNVSDEKNRKNFKHFLNILQKEGFKI